MPINRVGSIFVHDVKTTSKYVDKCVVEIYSDSGLTTLVGSRSSTVIWNGTHSVQKDLIRFNGLQLGSTYYLRAGFSSPITGTITWSGTWSQAVLDTTAPGTTYSGTYTATTAGVLYLVTPASEPSDIDHYEACYTVNDATAPSSTTQPDYPRLAKINGKLSFFAGGVPGDVVRGYIRGVDTSGNVQAWGLLGGAGITVPTVGSQVGNLDNIADGATYVRTTPNQRDGGGRAYTSLESNGSGGASGILLENTGTGGRTYALRSL